MLYTRIACEIDISCVHRYKQPVILDPVYKQIGEIIKSRRKTLGHKQEYLASKLGMSRGALANIETGRQRILVHQLYKFADVLELKPFDLLPPPSVNHSSAKPHKLRFSDNVTPQQENQLAQLIAQVDTTQKPVKERTYAKTSR